MKNSTRQKLRSKNGATMLMALLLMLVALMVSAVIISAAVSTVAGVRTGKEQQQAYLTVDSAVECFRQTLETGGKDSTSNKQYELVISQRYTNSDLKHPVADGRTEKATVSPEGPFHQVIIDAMYNMTHDLPGEYKQTYEITAEEAQYEPVVLELTVTPVYEGTVMKGGKLEAVFYTDPQENDGLCKIALTAEAALSVTVNEYRGDRTKTWTYNVSWGKATVETPKTTQGGNS